jgi:hypothetical protein
MAGAIKPKKLEQLQKKTKTITVPRYGNEVGDAL